ncbi:hypothetical protein A5693_18005 [Mycobacterium sp. E1319]|nr:hypothetical protein A5693_18005 [Mycobacterium sp. E1319]
MGAAEAGATMVISSAVAACGVMMAVFSSEPVPTPGGVGLLSAREVTTVFSSSIGVIWAVCSSRSGSGVGCAVSSKQHLLPSWASGQAGNRL